jgi:hypothetical protein
MKLITKLQIQNGNERTEVLRLIVPGRVEANIFVFAKMFWNFRYNVPVKFFLKFVSQIYENHDKFCENI